MKGRDSNEFTKYKEYRNVLNRAKRGAKVTYYRNLFENSKITKKILGCSKIS